MVLGAYGSYALAAWCLIWPLLAAAHADTGPAWLNSLISDRRPLEVYQEWWSNLTARLGVVAVGASLLLSLGWTRQQWADHIYRKMVGPAGPEGLALARIVASGVLLASLLWEDLPSAAELPLSITHGHGLGIFIFGIPGLDAVRQSPLLLAALQNVSIGFALLALAGLATRTSLLLTGLSYMTCALVLRQFGNAYHTGLIPLYVVLVLAFTPCADTWSLDALRHRRRRAGFKAPDRYGWSQFALLLCIVVPYVEAGFSKLCNGGLTWWGADNMRNIIFTDALNPMEFDFGALTYIRAAPSWVFVTIGVFAVLGEAAMGLVFFSRSAKLIMPALMIGMHLGILLLQNILFFDLIVLQCLIYGIMALAPAGSPWALPTLNVGQLPDTVKRWRQHLTTRPQSESALPSSPPRPLIALGCVLLFTWTFTIEFFPFTAMQMYSSARRGTNVTYYRVVVHEPDGTSRRGYPERWIPALSDSRYRFIIRDCFQPKYLNRCEAFVERLGTLMNRETQLASTIEVQKREWDFQKQPQDPNFGRTTSSFRMDFPGGH